MPAAFWIYRICDIQTNFQPGDAGGGRETGNFFTRYMVSGYWWFYGYTKDLVLPYFHGTAQYTWDDYTVSRDPRGTIACKPTNMTNFEHSLTKKYIK